MTAQAPGTAPAVTHFDLSPYARSSGIVLDRVGEDGVQLHLDFAETRGGAPGMFHGGQIGGLLQVAMDAALRAASGQAGKPHAALNSTVQYLRPGTPQRLYAAARVVRLGRQLGYVEAKAWQDDPEKPVALATANFTAPRGQAPDAP
jgi:uncharacterized protein (TIGR00369 family)